jgi:Rab-GTPase-TBC domain
VCPVKPIDRLPHAEGFLIFNCFLFYLFQLNKIMPIGRMLPILKEFGEFPDKYRPMIWKTILKLPSNAESFGLLLKRGPHSCVTNFEKRYSLVDQRALSFLKKTISCLAHWTVVFGYVNYLPKFVFPFLKMCKGDLLLCFELIATLLSNHCQLWFEFAPSNIPYNYLCLIENVLMESNRPLYKFYKSKNVTAKIYALPLLESAFSEVLDEQQWLQLWDHIVSNEPFFMVFLAVAYNTILQTTIMRYENVESIAKIFLEQNYMNFKKLITKANRLMETCPLNIHPKRYMKPFTPLTVGEYQKFENYPKNVSDMKVNEIDELREEQKVLDVKLAEMESFEKTIKSRMETQRKDEEYERRMKGKRDLRCKLMVQINK